MPSSRQHVSLFLIGSLAVSAACAGPEPTPSEGPQSPALAVDPAADSARAAIITSWATHVEAGKRGDAKAAMAVFDDDATYIEVGASQVHGREALDSLEAANFRAIRLLDGSHRVVAVTLVGNYAYEVGEASGSSQAPGQAPVTYGPVPYMASWRRGADQQWRVHFMVVSP